MQYPLALELERPRFLRSLAMGNKLFGNQTTEREPATPTPRPRQRDTREVRDDEPDGGPRPGALGGVIDHAHPIPGARVAGHRAGAGDRRDEAGALGGVIDHAHPIHGVAVGAGDRRDEAKIASPDDVSQEDCSRADNDTPRPPSSAHPAPPPSASLLPSSTPPSPSSSAAPPSSAPPLIRDRIELRLLLQSATSQEVLTIKDVPPTVQALKLYIKDKHSVPVSGQRIFFESMLLQDHETLPVHYMRSGDTVEVKFHSHGDLDVISTVVGILGRLVARFDSVEHLCQTGVQSVVTVQQVQLVESMCSDYFHTDNTEQSFVNFSYFCEMKGTNIMFKLLHRLQTHPWDGLPDMLKLLERSSLTACWDMSEMCVTHNVPAIRPALVRTVMLCASNTRPRTCSQCSTRPSHSASLLTASNSELVYKEIHYSAAAALSNLLEIMPSSRLVVATNEPLLRHLLELMKEDWDGSIDFEYETSLLMFGFMCMAYCTDTHQYFVKPYIIDEILRTSSGITQENDTFLTFIATLFFAILVSNSKVRHQISGEQMQSIGTFMAGFLDTTNYQQINRYEEDRGIYWAAIQPLMRVAYTPLPSSNKQPAEGGRDEYQMVLLCIEAALFGVNVVCINSRSKDILRKEGLLDYVHCLPYYLPPGTGAIHRAVQLVDCLKTVRGCPPSLIQMSKARLASMYFGLDNVLYKNIHELSTVLFLPSCNPET